ncbi:MAG: hypothetical protein CVU56_13160 [Deltaproteobacteria bacterium HGW-Deltaproteobacteria-14]|jgi:hypothetical protein|nr:MAG: hypothetical protein CVU56_13160 [Deltaproteobacteria bacterium HGW-Deltaproteobacteria-14]
MKVTQWTQRGRLRTMSALPAEHRRPDVLLVFGPRGSLEDGELAADLGALWPDAALLGCTTAGEISGTGVSADAVVITALSFDRAHARVAEVALDGDHGEAGRALAQALAAPDLRALIILSEGLQTRAQRLVDGLQAGLPPAVVIAGGLAGDGDAFARTGVITASGFLDHHAAALGIYGDAVLAGSASASGWHPFGLDRVVTRASGPVVYDIDGVRALDVYARYLGEEAAHRPSSALVYPVAILSGDRLVARSLSAVDHATGALTFFGEIPEGSRIRLMHASNAELVAGAGEAGALARLPDGSEPELALLFSCIGRKAVLGASTELEVDAVIRALAAGAPIAGFYTYGEIGGVAGAGVCAHHNQTMTVMVLGERKRR